MTYEQKYKDALLKAKSLQECSSNPEITNYLSELFPELKESEDERIRKWLVDTIKQVPDDSVEWEVIEKSKILAWLEKQGEQKPVSIHYDKNGNPDGVLVQTLDKSFVLDLHDAESGMKMTWYEAMKKYKLPTTQQWLFVMAYKDEVNKCLVEAGGEVLKTDDCYWSLSEHNYSNAWDVDFSSFYSDNHDKSYSYYVRALK